MYGSFEMSIVSSASLRNRSRRSTAVSDAEATPPPPNLDLQAVSGPPQALTVAPDSVL